MKGPSSNIESVVWAAGLSVRPTASILRLPEHTGMNKEVFGQAISVTICLYRHLRRFGHIIVKLGGGGEGVKKGFFKIGGRTKYWVRGILSLNKWHGIGWRAKGLIKLVTAGYKPNQEKPRIPFSLNYLGFVFLLCQFNIN